eukprot:74329-Pelagomonas_calceolata.AAC.3
MVSTRRRKADHDEEVDPGQQQEEQQQEEQQQQGVQQEASVQQPIAQEGGDDDDEDDAPQEVTLASSRAQAKQVQQAERQTRTQVAQQAKAQRREAEMKRQELRERQERQRQRRAGSKRGREQAEQGQQGDGASGSGYALEEDLLPQEVLDQLQQPRSVRRASLLAARACMCVRLCVCARASLLACKHVSVSQAVHEVLSRFQGLCPQLRLEFVRVLQRRWFLVWGRHYRGASRKLHSPGTMPLSKQSRRSALKSQWLSSEPTATRAPVPSKQQAKQIKKRKKLEQLRKGPVTVSVLSAVNKMASGGCCAFPRAFTVGCAMSAASHAENVSQHQQSS